MALLQKAYLGSTPLFRNLAWFNIFAPVIKDISALVTITANTNANTKGPWTQVIAATSENSSMLYLSPTNLAVTATNTASLLDIAIGPAGSETAILQNIAIGGTGNIRIQVPIKIPSGTRISARMQSVVPGGKTAQLQLITIDAGDYDITPTSVDVIGGDTSTSQGISFSGSSGTWIQAIASTTRAYRAVGLVLSNNTNDSANIVLSRFDLGVGASGSEIVFGNMRWTSNVNEFTATEVPFYSTYGRNIPAGSRLAVRHLIAANPNRYGFNLIGIP